MFFGFHKLQQLEWQHLERMKCLEKGLPLPDAELARETVNEQRSNQLTLIMIVGTLCLTGAPVAATAIILAQGQTLPAVCVVVVLVAIWCACALVLGLLAQHVMGALTQIMRATPDGASPGIGSPKTADLKLVPEDEDTHKGSSTAIQSSL
jgi:hypothetical protein